MEIKLLDWIEELILENCEGESFFDVFAFQSGLEYYMGEIFFNGKEY